MPFPVKSFSEDTGESQTPYGIPSSPFLRSVYRNREIIFLARHGKSHTIPPHRINYRANIWALHQTGIAAVIALTSVGGIGPNFKPGDIVLPDQFIDYTWGRDTTFFDGEDGDVAHVEMTEPFSSAVRGVLLTAARNVGVSVTDGGVYAVTQGPRFETPGEIRRIENDGGNIVGMTAMPEASLAAELGLCYACISVVVNPAAGTSDNFISQSEITEILKSTTKNLSSLLQGAIEIAPETFEREALLLRP